MLLWQIVARTHTKKKYKSLFGQFLGQPQKVGDCGGTSALGIVIFLPCSPCLVWGCLNGADSWPFWAILVGTSWTDRSIRGHGCCYFLVGSGWLVIFPGGLCMVTAVSWWALHGCCYFLVGSGWFLVFPVWMARRLHDTKVIIGMVNHHRVAEAHTPRRRWRIGIRKSHV